MKFNVQYTVEWEMFSTEGSQGQDWVQDSGYIFEKQLGVEGVTGGFTKSFLRQS